MLKFVGDICFADWYFDLGFGVGEMLQKGIDPLTHCPIQSNDIWIGNMECVISETSDNKGYDAKYFRTREKDFLNSSHCQIYAVANNHIMQHGYSAYINTLSAISKVGQYVGSNDRRSITFEHEGSQYGIVAFSLRGNEFSNKPLYWYRPELIEIKNECDKIADKDCKIAYMHWGNEFIDYPNLAQKKFSKWLIDIGFDLVIGCHPHVLQGFEIYKGKYIFYSIGNFLFNMPTAETRHSVIVNISHKKDKLDITYDYVFVDEKNMPRIIDKKSVPEKFTYEYLNQKIQIEDDNEVYYSNMFKRLSKYRKANHKWILKTLHKHDKMELIEMLCSYIKRRLR